MIVKMPSQRFLIWIDTGCDYPLGHIGRSWFTRQVHFNGIAPVKVICIRELNELIVLDQRKDQQPPVIPP